MKRQTKLVALAIISSFAFGAVTFGQSLAAVSKSMLTNIAGTGGSFSPRLSADGRHVAFVSYANDLVPNDSRDDYLDIFVRDLSTGQTRLVSVASSGAGGGNGDSNYPTISSNGLFVVFASEASNLVEGDTNGMSDVFVRDVLAGTTRLVSTAGASNDDGIVAWPVKGSSRPVMTEDGRYVVFESTASNVVVDDTNYLVDIFLHDLETGNTELITRGFNGEASSGSSSGPSISADGRMIAFTSTATSLVPGVTNRLGDIYLHDRQTGTTTWISTNVASQLFSSPRPYRCLKPALSADGRYVGFKVAPITAPNIQIPFIHDVQSGQTTRLTPPFSTFVNSSAGTLPALSADGRYMAYETVESVAEPWYTNFVYVWDSVASNKTVIAKTSASGASPPLLSYMPAITPDGRYVAFLSTTTNLVTQASNTFQLYVHDRDAGTTQLASVNRDGSPSAAGVFETVPSLSSDGKIVAFESVANDLVEGDLNGMSDVFVRDLETQITRLISARRSVSAFQTAPSHSIWPGYAAAASGDGAIIAFTSVDNSYTAADTNRQIDVFVANLTNGIVSPVSMPRPQGLETNHIGHLPLVSAHGEFVLFHLQDVTFEGLDPPTRANAPNWLFRQYLLSGAIELVSTQQVRIDIRPSLGGESLAISEDPSPIAQFLPVRSDDRRTLPSISADGNLIAYTAGNRGSMQVYLRDMAAATNLLVSVSPTGQAGGGSSFKPLLSPDHRRIVFESLASNIVTNTGDGVDINLYVRDLSSNVASLVSVDADWQRFPGRSTGAVFTVSGRYLAFQNAANPNASPDGYLFDLDRTRPAQMICANCSDLTLTADARVLAFARRRFASSNFDIWEKKLSTKQESLVTSNRTGTGRANGSSTMPQISPDGRFIIFQSTADDLVANDDNNASDVFVRDRALGVTMLASRSRDGSGSGRGLASRPIMAADGRTVIFHSTADDLVHGDYNKAYDIFVLRLGAGDSDNDGLDDGWEMAYFGDLSRDGRDDYDGDTRTDAAEFLAGTDPTNAGSVFTVLSITAVGSARTTLVWSAVPGRNYQAQFKNSLNDSIWIDLAGTVTATDSTASYVDTSAAVASARFYRVVLVQ